MKKARALDLKTGLLIGSVRASEMSEEKRRAYDYSCANPACSCTVHWRKAHRVNENTETRPALFAKNPSSNHIAGCYHDYDRIAEERQEYTHYENGVFHIRANFALGAGNRDTYPMRGYLRDEHLRATAGTKHMRPFGNLHDLLKFVEANLGDIDRDDLPDLIVHYQGKIAKFEDLLIANRNYETLLQRSIQHDENGDTKPAFAIIRPTHEIARNQNGKRRFACEPQTEKVNGRNHHIQPIVVCYNDNPHVADALAAAAKQEKILTLSARPFSNSMRRSWAETQVYLSVRHMEQIAVVDDRYWRAPPPVFKTQLDLFETGSPAAPTLAL